MRRVQHGDRAAYEALYARWKDRIFSFLHRRTLSASLAEEAHQETWLRVYRWRDRYDPNRPFRSWLYTLACHAGHDTRRPEPTGFELAEATGDPHEVRDTLVRALGFLGDDDRRLLLLIVEGFTTAEAAELMNLGHVATRMRLHRARQRIREALDAA